MDDVWTSSAIADRLYIEMCRHDEEEKHSTSNKYSVKAIRYASRRAVVKHIQDFTDVILLYIENFSPPLKQQILNLCSDLESINTVVTSAVFRIIKSKSEQVFYEYIQNEPLRWSLLNGDGNGKGDGPVIVEYIPKSESQSGEDATKIQYLARLIMMDNIFKTMTDNGQLYRYNGQIYIPDQEWLIKQQCRIYLPKVTTHQIQEVINYIKDTTYLDRSLFECNPDIINLRNGLLNIHTLEIKEHSHNEYFLSQLPMRYDATAKCPNIIRFLGQVLKPNDIFTALELVGYCLYKTAKFEKAVLFVR